MSPVVRALRIALPILFVAFIVIIYFSYSKGPRRPRTKKPTTVEVPKRPKDQARSVSEKFDDVQTIGGRVALKIHAEKFVAYVSEWTILQDVKLTVYRTNGQTYEISCAQAEVQTKTREAVAKGGVKVTSTDGVSLETDSIHYDGSKVQNKIPVRFTVDTWSGSAGGLDLDVAHETLELLDGFDAKSHPKVATEQALHVRSRVASFNRSSGDATFRGSALVERESDLLAADEMSFRYELKAKKLTSLSGSGNVVMDLAPSSTTMIGSGDQVGTSVARGDRFYSEPSGTGEINVISLVGEKGPAVVTMSGPPARTLTAKQFRMVTANRVITEVQANQDVVMTETGPPLRRATSKVASLYFDAAARKPSTLYLQDDITFKDDKVEAKSDRASYELATKKLVLSALPQSAPTVKTETETLRATLIEVRAGEQILSANGAVFAELRQKPGVSVATDSALFPEKQPVYVNSDNAVLQRATRTAQFTGNVRAWQGTNTIFADQMNAVGEGEVLNATGNVRGSLSNTERGSGERSGPILSRSDQLTAKRREKRVDLDGNVRLDDQGRVLQSQKATIFLDDKQKVDHVEASGKVTMSERATGRKGSGDHALYKLAQKTLWLDGNPATVADAKGTIKGKEIVFDIDKNKVEVLSGASPTEATYNPQ